MDAVGFHTILLQGEGLVFCNEISRPSKHRAIPRVSEIKLFQVVGGLESGRVFVASPVFLWGESQGEAPVDAVGFHTILSKVQVLMFWNAISRLTLTELRAAPGRLRGA